jgi:hypothetical protein
MRFARTMCEHDARHHIFESHAMSLRMTPTDIVQRQLDAYNAHDLDAFTACFSDDVRLYRMPEPTPNTIGIEALRTFYAEHRFSIPTLRAELVNRIAFGDKVADHERIHGLSERPVEMMAVYQVRDGAIVNAWFFAA